MICDGKKGASIRDERDLKRLTDRIPYTVDRYTAAEYIFTVKLKNPGKSSLVLQYFFLQ
jgi:hypothetical protein